MRDLSDEEKRRDQLLRAEGSTEEDAAPRIAVSDHDGVTRVDILPDAVVRPGSGPGAEEAETSAPEPPGTEAPESRTL
jgi:hypothetical protein